MFRIGQSRDIHRLENNNRPLIISGIKFDFEKGPVSHSDGDVVYHALAEAMLGSLALGDLGTFFPDNDDKYLDMDSKEILLKCYSFILEEGYKISNIDINIIAIKMPIRHIFCFGFKFLKKDLILFILYTPYSWYNYNTNF